MSHWVDKGLNNLIKALRATPHVRVGILSGKSPKRKDPQAKVQNQLQNAYAKASGTIPTNAEIGAAHEFGSFSHGLPVRSFLRMPINDHLKDEIKISQAAFKAGFAYARLVGSLTQFLGRLGVAGEKVCRTAFTNGGYGLWAPVSPARAKQKTVSDILVETTQLRESIAYQVVK